MDFFLATATVVATTAIVAATAVISCICAVTAAAEQEDKDDNPSTTATTKAIITHNQDLLICLSSHTMLSEVCVLQKFLQIIIDYSLLLC